MKTDLLNIASLLDFPDEGTLETVNEIQLLLDGKYPELGMILEPFTEYVSVNSVNEVRELYTRTFEVQAITTLDLGYLLFGDDYKRAELLVNLSREHTLIENDCGFELADHLPNVVRLLARMQDELIQKELVEKIVNPGLKKMIAEFDPMNLGKKNELYIRHHKTLIDTCGANSTMYQRPLVVMLEIICREFGLSSGMENNESGFVTAMAIEMKLEE